MKAPSLCRCANHWSVISFRTGVARFLCFWCWDRERAQ